MTHLPVREPHAGRSCTGRGTRPTDLVFCDARGSSCSAGTTSCKHISSNALMARSLDGATAADRHHPLHC